MSKDNSCSPIDLKKAAALQNNGKSFRMFQDIPNPIPLEITDPDDIKRTFHNYPFIPYAHLDHNSAQGLLVWLNSMRFLSPTHGSCITSLHTYSLGLPLSVVKQTNSDFDLSENIEGAKLQSFVDYITDVQSFEYGQSLKTIATENFLSLKDNGNIYVEVRISKLLGKENLNIIPLPTERVCYVKPEGKSHTRYVGISHQWDYGYITRYPPRILPVYPAYQMEDENTLTTVIHVKNPTQNLYGRPDWLSAFISVYREFQDNNYLVKQTANNFMGQALIELEEAQQNDSSILDDTEAQKAGFENAAHRFEANFMAKSDDPQTVVLLSRPYGAKNAFVYQFKPNTSETFYKTMSELEEIDIIRAHQWSKRFLGENQTQGFSKDVFVDELKVKEVAVLPYLRFMSLDPINKAIDLALQFFGRNDFKNYTLTGTSNIKKLIEMMPQDMEKNDELTQNTSVEI